MARAAFIPRPKRGLLPTRSKFNEVPGVPPPAPTPVAAWAKVALTRLAEITPTTNKRRMTLLIRSLLRGPLDVRLAIITLAQHTGETKDDRAGPCPDRPMTNATPTVNIGWSA